MWFWNYIQRIWHYNEVPLFPWFKLKYKTSEKITYIFTSIVFLKKLQLINQTYCHKSQHWRTFIKNCFIVQTCDQSEMAQCLSHAVIIPPCISCVAPHLHRMQISRTEHKDSIRIETNFFIFFFEKLLSSVDPLLLPPLRNAFTCMYFFILFYIFFKSP